MTLIADARYDVFVVGARCAGSPPAMLLARSGYRDLMADRAGFPIDTLSTHCIQPPGVAASTGGAARPADPATGCPPMNTLPFDFGAFARVNSGSMSPSDLFTDDNIAKIFAAAH